MSVYFQALALGLVGCILAVLLGDHAFRQLLMMGCTALVLTAVIRFLQPVMEFFSGIQQSISLDSGVFSVLWKVLGITLISEFAAMLCADAGNNALGKAVQMLGCAVCLWQGLPVISSLLSLVEDILGGI